MSLIAHHARKIAGMRVAPARYELPLAEWLALKAELESFGALLTGDTCDDIRHFLFCGIPCVAT